MLDISWINTVNHRLK